MISADEDLVVANVVGQPTHLLEMKADKNSADEVPLPTGNWGQGIRVHGFHKRSTNMKFRRAWKRKSIKQLTLFYSQNFGEQSRSILY